MNAAGTRLGLALSLWLSAGLAVAQQPATPESPPAATPPTPPASTTPAAEAPPKEDKLGPLNRRVIDGPPTVLAFKNVTVEQLLPFIVEATGKVMMPQQDVLTRRVTIVNDRPIARQDALDLVLFALQQAGVGVIETDDKLILRDIGEIVKSTDMRVIGPEDSLLDRADIGTFAEKVYALRHASAENIGAILKDSLPDFAKMTVDKESNQVVITGNIGLLKRLERIITSLDQPAAASLVTETFRLRYADADVVAQNIKDLFSASTTGAGAQGGNQNQFRNPFQQLFGPGGGGGGGRGGNNQGRQGGGGGGGQNRPGQASDATATSANLRATANAQQNSVTVLAERQIIEQIRAQIEKFWDLPVPKDFLLPKVYDLKNTDPVKMRDLLEKIINNQRTTTSGGNAGFGQSPTTSTTNGPGVNRLAGQVAFEAMPESGRLLVMAKSPDNLAFIDTIIQDLDRPQDVGLPQIIELKHANAEELAEQINTLLAQDGTLASVQRAGAGLTSGTSTTSPFARDTTAGATQNANQQNQNQQGGSTATTLAFWWQRSRPPTDRRGASNLIGELRIVPVWRQNALMIIAPPEYKASIVGMIQDLDKPGRQVLVSAIIAEVSTDDATSLGLRWATGTITPSKTDNAINIGPAGGGNQTIAGIKNNLLPGLFDTSVLSVGTNLNVLLQALNEKTGVKILSEPRIFTSDNQEAQFFSGQDIPFVTDSQVNNQGNITQSFDYRAVGIQLRCRPRITVNRNVDMSVNVQLANINATASTPTLGFVVDRRETTTQLILQDGQTLVLSGIRRKEISDIVRKVPLLGDIPLLGLLFKSTEKEATDSELLIFITPIVVQNAEEQKNMNDPYLNRLDELQGELNGPKHTPSGSSAPPVKPPEKSPDAPQDTPTAPQTQAAAGR